MDSFRNFLVVEMRVHGTPDGYKNVLAFRGHLWLFDSSEMRDPSEQAEIVVNTVLEEHPDADELETHIDEEPSLYDVQQWFQEYIPDSLTGSWDSSSRILHLYNYGSVAATSSPLVRKVATALGARHVQMDEENAMGQERTWRFRRRELLGDWPAEMYHGTASRYLEDILRLGLRPGESPSNYDNVTHPELVFLASSFSEAASHAFHTAMRIGQRVRYGPISTEMFPIVIQCRVPDQTNLVPDWDVDAMADRTHYPHHYDTSSRFSVPSIRAGKHLGAIGYRGRIPANQITAVFVWSSDANNWRRITNIREFLRRLRDQGTEDFLTYRYGSMEWPT